MSQLIEKAIDARQSPEWAEYMTKIGWLTEKVGSTYIFIRQVKFLNHSLIKIQHPVASIPFQEIDAIAKKYNALFVLLEPHVRGYDQNQYEKYGYTKTPMRNSATATLLLDLDKTEEQMIQSFSENARRNIKKALSNNITLKTYFLNDPENEQKFEQFYKLLKNLSQMKKFYIPDFTEYQHKMRSFKERAAVILAYDDQNVPIAGLWVACTQNIMLYVHTGITTEGYNQLANYSLIWEALKLAKQFNVQILDFEGIFDERYPKEKKNWQGFSEFKKRFHGEEVYYPQIWIKIYNIPYKIIHTVASLWIR